MKARLSFPVVVMGPIANGATEHAAFITRVWPELNHGNDDTEHDFVVINCLMFPDGGGESQFQNQIALYDSRQVALASGDRRRLAYWAANS